MIVNPYDTEIPFVSRTLRNVVSRLDNTIFTMEEELKMQEDEIKELKDKIWELEKEKLATMNKSIGNALLSLVGTPDVQDMGPAAAIMLVKMREMNSVEEIHQYIDEMREKLKETIQ